MRRKLDTLCSHREIVGEKASGAWDHENCVPHASHRGSDLKGGEGRRVGGAWVTDHGRRVTQLTSLFCR